MKTASQNERNPRVSTGGDPMSPHGKKYIAPVLITAAFLLYLLAYLAFVLTAAAAEPLVILFGIPLLLLAIGMIYTLYTRIREIRSGEEDDLDNY